MGIKSIALVAATLALSTSANSTLLERLGGLAYYDDVANLTWLADANAGAGSTFDDGFSSTDGRMTWQSANNWATSLDINGVTGWRLANTLQPDTSCSGQSSGGTVSTGFSCTGSEMGHLFNVEGISAAASGPFSNVQVNNYWSGTEFAPDTRRAWGFHLNSGNQSTGNKVANLYAWAVQSGDVSATVSEPAIIWLLGVGLLGVIGVAGRKKV